MSEILSFLAEHWALTLMLVFLLGYLVILEGGEKIPGTKHITPPLLVDCLNHKKGVVLDLREKAAFESGHILGAISVSLDSMDKTLKKIHNNKQHPVVLCAPEKGQLATKCAAVLKQKGFQDVRILQGGIDAWELAGMPLVKE